MTARAVALQVSVPSMVVDAIESLNAENPDHVRALFQLRVSELQMTLAAEDNLHDVRCAASLRPSSASRQPGLRWCPRIMHISSDGVLIRCDLDALLQELVQGCQDVPAPQSSPGYSRERSIQHGSADAVQRCWDAPTVKDNPECAVCARFAIGACAVEDLAAHGQTTMLLRANPRMADARRSGARPKLQRCFQVSPMPC